MNLTQYALGGIFSPESAPFDSGATTSAAPDGVGPASLFNINTITRGISTADFYAAVPAAFVRFLENDSETKLIAKPQLRGSEGSQLTLNLGDEIPVPSTVFTPIATGGAATNPLTSFTYRPVGVNVEMTPRVTFNGDIILDLVVESSTLGQDILIAGQSLPTFGSRKVQTRLRLRDGESNLLAGLLREDERRSLQGFPGLMRLPILRQLFSANDSQITQTDIIMLLTPRIVRTHQLTEEDLRPIYIGTQQNIGLTGPPPLIARRAESDAPATGDPSAEPAPAPAANTARLVPRPPDGSVAVPTVPPGSSPIPGMTTSPADPSLVGSVPPLPVLPPTETPAIATPLDPAGPGAAQTPNAPVNPVLDATNPALPARPADTVADGRAGGNATQSAQIVLTPPGLKFQVGAGQYIVPLSISGAARIADLTVTLVYSPAVLRVRAVQEGSFMRQGGVTATFAQDVDTTSGRVDITITRIDDSTGASGSGLLAAVLFEPVAAGRTELEASGVARTPSGGLVPLTFAPVAIEVR